MTVDMDKIIDRIRKLAALANNNDNEHQAAAATAKMQELLEAYNLDMAVLGQSGKGAQRSDTKKKGGLYSWQRKLWQGVAELNFCYYFSLKGLARGAVYEHRLIGSHANVVSTELMATYLQDTVERLAQKWAKENGYGSVFVRDAIAYREGMAARIVAKLNDRRRELVNEQKRKDEERKREQARNAMPVTGTELSIIDVISTEADFNNDYMNGWEMGTTARNRAEAQARQAAADAAYREHLRKQKEWDEAHPEEAAARKRREQEEYNKLLEKWNKQDAARARRRNKTPPKPHSRRETPEEQRANLYSYREGYHKGAEVGIDTQVDRDNRRRIG